MVVAGLESRAVAVDFEDSVVVAAAVVVVVVVVGDVLMVQRETGEVRT